MLRIRRRGEMGYQVLTADAPKHCRFTAVELGICHFLTTWEAVM